jgi:hypothetical protein
VAASFLVLWRRWVDHAIIEQRFSEMFARPVKLFYLAEILESGSAAVRAVVRDRLELLNWSVGRVRQLLHASGSHGID